MCLQGVITMQWMLLLNVIQRKNRLIKTLCWAPYTFITQQTSHHMTSGSSSKSKLLLQINNLNQFRTSKQLPQCYLSAQLESDICTHGIYSPRWGFWTHFWSGFRAADEQSRLFPRCIHDNNTFYYLTISQRIFQNWNFAAVPIHTPCGNEGGPLPFKLSLPSDSYT